jgi:uncharacterized membrane protein
VTRRRADGEVRSAFSALALVAAVAIAPAGVAADAGGVSDDWVMTTVRRHCAMCHSETPSHTMLLGQAPPKGVVLESIEDVRRLAPRIFDVVVQKKIMPFGNETAMTDADRVRFGQWLLAQ